MAKLAGLGGGKIGIVILATRPPERAHDKS